MGYADEKYQDAKEWISRKIESGATWDDVSTFCVDPSEAYDKFDSMMWDESILPDDMTFEEWPDFVASVKSGYSTIVDPYGLFDKKNNNNLPIPSDYTSPWCMYKKYLLGTLDGKRRISDDAVSQIEKNCHWILNHISRDTRELGPKKGLVMGSVQSGKTANMIGLTCMAAHYDWNFIIILSGTIDNLRKQTLSRFHEDLTACNGSVIWHVLDKASKPEFMKDMVDEKNNLVKLQDLKFSSLKNEGNKSLSRYITVCLKNSTRLRNLIEWLHNDSKASRLRVLIIDDEADQASVNTKKMDLEETDEDMIERTAVNNLIINLVHGKDSEGRVADNQFQAMNYVCFTATPYANILNEAYENSLYPRDFICNLPESNEYFGPKVIFGSYEDDEKYPGLDIVNHIPVKELDAIKDIHKYNTGDFPETYKDALCWFLCTAAVMRIRQQKNPYSKAKPISMLIHNTAVQNGHFNEYEKLKTWLNEDNCIARCKTVYAKEKDKLDKEQFEKAFPEYALLDQVDYWMPEEDALIEEIKIMLKSVQNIEMGDEGPKDDKNKYVYTESGIHLCVDNCRAPKYSEDGTYLRIVYPTDEQLKAMKKSPVFIILGGNTLARGLTLEGLCCTYFGRNVNLADSLMQMGRWFGYRRGCETLQRIWMTVNTERKFEKLEELDEKLKEEFQEYMDKGKSPAEFGPRITSTASIARFLITSRNKSQNAEACDFDFSGNSYETTEFANSNVLKDNLVIADHFIGKLGKGVNSTHSKAYVWRGVDSQFVISEFLQKYNLYPDSSLSMNIPIFIEWLTAMNQENKYTKWNVAFSGFTASDEDSGFDWNKVIKVERSKKKDRSYIDIGSMRSGSDVLCDIDENSLTDKQKTCYQALRHRTKGQRAARTNLGLGEVPLLLLYLIDKDKGKVNKKGTREAVNSKFDILACSIVLGGEDSASYVKTMRVRKPEEEE